MTQCSSLAHGKKQKAGQSSAFLFHSPDQDSFLIQFLQNRAQVPEIFPGCLKLLSAPADPLIVFRLLAAARLLHLLLQASGQLRRQQRPDAVQHPFFIAQAHALHLLRLLIVVVQVLAFFHNVVDCKIVFRTDENTFSLQHKTPDHLRDDGGFSRPRGTLYQEKIF